MMLTAWCRVVVLAGVAGMCFAIIGCNQPGGESATGTDNVAPDGSAGVPETAHNLHGYWCVAHGVPEEVCGQCNKKLAAEFQQQGDWCVEHNRPDSQCFIHHPELADKFMAQYRAKFGEEPPARVAE